LSAGRRIGVKPRRAVSKPKPFQVRFNDGWQVRFNNNWVRCREVSIQASPIYALNDGIFYGEGVIERRGQDIVITS
jgi:hypothetical protein